MIEFQLHGSCKSLKDVPEGATITSINDRIVIGTCEGCGKRIFDDSKGVTRWADDVLTCKKCGGPDEDDYIAYGMLYHHNPTKEYGLTTLENTLTELVKLKDEYIKLLSDELNETVSLAIAHNWQSTRVKAGSDIREKIKEVETRLEQLYKGEIR